MDERPKGKPEPRSRPVMVRLPLDMWRDLDTIAKRELGTVAAVLRRLAKERLDQVKGEHDR